MYGDLRRTEGRPEVVGVTTEVAGVALSLIELLECCLPVAGAS
jgi:hypothetical protein